MDSQAELLGPLLVEEKLLVPEQLELALQFAQSSGLPLDQIVVAEFAVPQPDISRLLERMSRGADDAEEWNVEPIAPDLPPVRPLGFIRRPIGQIFVDLGFITPDDREAALNIQRESGGLLGEILIEQGKLTRLELANALSEHWESATGDGGNTPEPPRALVEVPSLAETPRVDMSELADLRRSLDELESARIADAQAMEARVADISEAVAGLGSRDADGFQRATTERLQELEETIESATSRSAAAVDLEARIDALAAATVELRSEIDALPSGPVDAAPNGRVDELAQAIEAGSQNMADRLATLAAELRAETTTRTDDLSAELRALAEAVEGSRPADAEVATTAIDELRERLDELASLRATDHEATLAAQSQAAADASHIERTLRSELEALASRPAAGEPDGRVDEVAQAIEALTQTTDDRLTTLATQLNALSENVERSRAADAEAARTASDQVRENLEAELEALASRPAAGEPDARVDEVAQAIEALTQTTDDRLTTLATELRAEARAHSDTSAEHRAQIDDLAASVDGLREAVAGSHAETNRNGTAWADESRALLDRLDELDAARSEEGEATRVVGDALRERLDELIALRVTDLEAAQAAQERAAAETNRIEQTLVGGLAELAIQVDELTIELRERAAHAEPVALDSSPAAEQVDARGSVAARKGPKRDKNKAKKKKPKH